MVNTIELEELVAQINYHNDLYHGESYTKISDTEFDTLVEKVKSLVVQLQKEDPENELIISGKTVIETIGSSFEHDGDTIKFGKVAKMGSLDKIYTVEDLIKWGSGIGLTSSDKLALFPKIDGLSVVDEYHNGILTLGATTGDGIQGTDKTPHFKALESIPNEIGYKGSIYLRGEMYMKKSTLVMLSETGEGTFANCRNAASGSLLCDDPLRTASRKLDFFVYNVEVDGVDFNTEEEKTKWIEKNIPEITYVPMQIVDFTNESIKSVIKDWEENIRKTLDYDIDGLVFGANKFEIQESAGWNKRIPIGKKAFKFKAEQKESTVVNFAWQSGFTGKITPVLEIEPTYISGSTVRRISLHNYGFIQDKKIELGDTILFEKAGDIIPYFVRVTDRHGRDDEAKPRNEMILLPENCPSCNVPTVILSNMHLVCENPLCDAKKEQQIEMYIKRLELKGIGISIVRKLLDNNIITDIPSLYTMDFDKISKLDGYGTRSAQKIIDLIMNNREVDLWRFISMMGIVNVGTTASKALALKFKTLDAVRGASRKDLKEVDRFGITLVNDVSSGLEACSEMIDKLLEYVTVRDAEKPKEGMFTGMTFCVTGTMPSGNKRNVIHALVEENGGTLKSGVSAGLSYLVAGDKAGSKLAKAEKNNVNVLTEDDFMAMIS